MDDDKTTCANCGDDTCPGCGSSESNIPEEGEDTGGDTSSSDSQI